jgi:hypothetical protein
LSEQKPTVGRIVHYHSLGSLDGRYPSAVPRAAVVTEVYEAPFEGVSLTVLNPTGLQLVPNVLFSAEPKAGCWSWPPRV